MVNRVKLLKYAVLATIFACSPAFAQGPSPWQESYTLESQGKYAQASAVLDPILRNTPNNDFAVMRLAWLNHLQGKNNDAIRDYNKALMLNPQSLEAREGLSLALMAQQRWKEAEVELKKITAVSAWDYTAHSRLLVCEEGQHKWDELSKHAAEIVAHYPSDANSLVFLARAEAWLGNIKKAKSAYAQVLERLPAHIEAIAYLKNNP